MKNIKKILFISALGVFFIGLSQVSADYTLDENFGTDGAVIYDNTLIDYSGGSVTDGSGNTYASAWIYNGLGRDIILLKYDSSGNLADGFPKTYNSGYDAVSGDLAQNIGIDNDGYVYIVGSTENSTGGEDLILLKYDSSGNLESGFPKTYDSGYDSGVGDRGTDIAFDSSDNVYISGWRENSGGHSDLIFLKYDSSGNVASGYPKIYDSGYEGGGYGDIGTGIVLDESGNVYISGGTENSAGESEVLLVAFDSSGSVISGFPKTYDSGILLGGYDWDIGEGIDLDSSGNIFITGAVGNALGASDLVFLKYNSSGNLAAGFPKTYDSGYYAQDMGDFGYTVIVNSNDDVFIGGTAENSEGLSDAILVKYDNSGNLYGGYPLSYGNYGPIMLYKISADNFGNIFGFGTMFDESVSVSDLVLLKYITEPEAPTASPAGGNYSTGQSVELASTTGDAEVRYTLDGSTPTTSSLLYATPINVAQSLTLKAKAFKSQLASELMTESYVISTTAVIAYHIPSVAVGSKKVFTLDENSITYVKKAKVAFRGVFDSIANGKVRIYKSGKLIKKVNIDKTGKWRAKTKINRKGTNSYQFKYYDSADQLVETTPSYQLAVDKRKPVVAMGKTIDIPQGGTVEWQVTDNDSLDYCTCSFRGKGYPVSGYSFSIPNTTPSGISNIRVTCYDQAGNKGTRKAKVNVE